MLSCGAMEMLNELQASKEVDYSGFYSRNSYWKQWWSHYIVLSEGLWEIRILQNSNPDSKWSAIKLHQNLINF